ncbi:hypothetical protein TFLX_00209 [Thermoflexales bacterium]|nr:hypothetical protein TFLX_00209 [Thermoflexales bacterium]
MGQPVLPVRTIACCWRSMPIVYTVGDMLLFNMKFIVAGELLVLIALGNQDE